jgi:hypothetical protein
MPNLPARCFTGIEVEGRFRGLQTLFVPMTVLMPTYSADPSVLRAVELPHAAWNALTQDKDHPHVYLGAGNDNIRSSNIEWLPFARLASLISAGKVITLEVDHAAVGELPMFMLLPAIRLLITVNMSGAMLPLQRQYEVKLVGRDCNDADICVPMQSIDCLYAKDKKCD